MKGIITAYIVNSSKISAEERHTLLDALKKVENDLGKSSVPLIFVLAS